MEFASKTRHAKPVQRAKPSHGVPSSPVNRDSQAEISRVLRSVGAQAKLSIGQPNDKYEQEADRVADQVMRMSDADVTQRVETGAVQPPRIQRMCAECEEEQSLQRQLEEEEDTGQTEFKGNNIQRQAEEGNEPNMLSDRMGKIQRMCSECEEKIHRKEVSSNTPLAINNLESRINNLKSGGRPLDLVARAFFEPRFGYDFSNVRVHADSAASDTASAINARAFTLGNHVVMGSGEYNLDSESNWRLLGHELTHVVQQGGAQKRIQRVTDETLNYRAETMQQREEASLSFFDSISDIASDTYDAATATIDLLATGAGALARNVASAFGVSVDITSRGLEIRAPGFCPVDAFPLNFNVPDISKELMTPPLFGFPIAPDLFVSGEVGVTGNISPNVQLQLGPLCLNNLHIIINPITDHYSITGSISGTTAAVLQAELRGGLRAQLSLNTIIPIGGVPVPISIPAIGLEGGLAGMIRGIGANTLTLGGHLSYNNGIITATMDESIDLGLGSDLFLGAYGQLNLGGQSLCRIYWQPWEWHGDIGASLGLSASMTIVPGNPVVFIPRVQSPVLSQIPFDQFPLAINRSGFSDDCPIKDRLCSILRNLGLFPSQRGGVWGDEKSPYGPGRRLPAPLLPSPTGPEPVYERTPSRASGASCRGACGPDCDTCNGQATYIYVEAATGDVWKYTNFEKCDSHKGCREHDAGFDWAAAQGEVGHGGWDIIYPWHMAANIECACNYLAGNCLAWVFGLPPYDKKMYFADSVKKLNVSDPDADGDTSHPGREDLPCGDAKMPYTVVTYIPSGGGKGNKVVAKPLTRCEGNTHGSKPISRRDWPTGWECVVHAGETRRWVRAHLLHGYTNNRPTENLHGSGNDRQNIIISDKSINSNMERNVETPAINLIYQQQQVLWYEVDVRHFTGDYARPFFAESVHMRYGLMDPETGVESAPIFDDTIISNVGHQPPACPDDSTNPSIHHETEFSAAENPSKTRTEVGVGEKVVFTSNVTGDWSASAGEPSTLDGVNRFEWRASDRSETVTIKLASGGKEAIAVMTVVEPRSIKADKISEIVYPVGQQGVGMKLIFNYYPKTVSFGNVQSKEVSGPATNVTGYFLHRGDLSHDSGDTFFSIRENNKDSVEDTAALWGYPSPWSRGGFQWVIPNHFKVNTEAGDGKRYTTVAQIFLMDGATGKTTITKAGAEVERSS